MNKPYFYQHDFKAAFLASMTERLGDHICSEAAEIFKSNDISTPVNDASFLLFLNENGPSSIADIARALNFSHQRVALRINNLEKLKVVTRSVDKQDQRRKVIKLTNRSKKEMVFIEQMLTKTSRALEDLFQEIDVDLMDKIAEALTALEQTSLSERIEMKNARLP